MGDELSVRRYRPADDARVRELRQTAVRDVGAYVADALDDDLETIRETFLERGGEFLVGEADERIVAMEAFGRSTTTTTSDASSTNCRRRPS